MIKETFLETIKEYKMLASGDSVLIAVSGGADSLALLHLLAEYQKELGIAIHIAHLNHMIRKGDADLDVRFVQAVAQKLGLQAIVESFDVQSFAKEEKIGLEDAARRARYAFYDRAANQVGANKIAVGHTADDNVETFLMRLLRGSGLKGLCGIPPVRGKIIRPLIKVWRREINEYVDSLKLVPRSDHTNYESRFTRNRVRLKLIPQLKIYNLNIKEIILQTILLLTDDQEYIDGKAQESLVETYISGSENEIKLNLKAIKEREGPVQGHLLRKAIEKVKGDLLDLTFKHIQDILEKLESTERWELHLPGQIYAAGNGREIIISKQKPEEPEDQAFFYTTTVPGEVTIKELNKKIKIEWASTAELTADPNVAFVDYASLGKNIIVRSRGEGDRFVPFGMKGSKKLQDFFVDEKIPQGLRGAIAIVESNGRIIWLAGWRLDDRAKITKNTKKIVKFELL
ncbi:tRNA lysidine(34) synthetase TilS [Candidatus Saganbacteria bacterium]|nr:tRNA lysidine(34) synthetase TilS [Candidatus Saganbacteria bacterium]